MPEKFAVGDKVTWTHTSSNGNHIRFSTREGRIVELGPSIAVCQMRNGRKTWLLIEKLTHAGEPSELTKAFMAMATNTPPQPENP